MRERTLGIALAATAACATAAFAGVDAIDSVRIQERRFNDFPNSTLTTTNDFPTLVSFDESAFGTGGWANQHMAYLSDTAGASDYAFQNADGFDISVDVTLDVGSTAPRKEAGFRFDTFIGGEAFFFATSDGEVAAFGAFFPFYSFGTSAYTPGDTSTMTIKYRPGDGAGGSVPATLEYIFDGMSSGPLDAGNLENGFIDGTVGGFFVQSQPDSGNPDDYSNASFGNIDIQIPAPGALGVLGLAGVVASRRRR
jgi:hypothetical protein